MRFNVLIATYNRCPMLARTLGSLQAAGRPAGFERVLVIENGPQMGAEDICREASRNGLPVEYHHIAAAGKGRALQHGLNVIKDGFVLFLDDDVRVSPSLLEIYSDAAQRHGARAFYGGPLQIDYEEQPPEWLIRYLPPSAKGWELKDGKKGWKWFLGANYGAFVEEILSLGGVRANLGPGALSPGTANNPVGQETELQQRMFAAGYEKIYLPEAVVWHYVPKESCTQAWALHRAYRSSITSMMTQDAATMERFGHGVQWFGVTRGLWRKLAASALHAVAARFVRDKKRSFEMRREFSISRGLIRGARLRGKTPTDNVP